MAMGRTGRGSPRAEHGAACFGETGGGTGGDGSPCHGKILSSVLHRDWADLTSQ
jgi:hypothetical protein